MKRPLIFFAVASLIVGACGGDDDDDASPGGGAAPAGEAAASPFTPAPPEGAEDIPVEPGSYNYSPAVIDEGDKLKAWWCSAVPDAATDNIWYQEYDKKTKQASNRKSVLQVGRPGSPDWDSFGVCHPSVIRGEWPNPGGEPFTYAMYYTSTNVSQGGGSNNSTGVVFSTDGITWSGQHDRHNPNIKQKVPNVRGTYGAGLPSAWSRGGSKVTLFWIDTTWERSNNPASPDGYRSRALVAQSEDGIRFGPPTVVSQNGAAAYWKNDFAIDDSVSPPVVYSTQGLNFRVGTGPEDKNETYNIGIYRIPMDELLAGGGVWEHLGFIDTNLTGLPLNLEPGIARTGEGNVPGDVKEDGLRIWYGGGGQTPRSWQLRETIFRVNDGRLALRQHSRAAGGATSYWATTGFVPASLRSGEAKTLGFLDAKSSPGTVPLYGCQRGPLTTAADGLLTGEGADRFLALESCGDANVLGINGYLFPEAQGTSTKPLYACKDGQAQFVSNDAGCEGKTVEKLLGHVRAG